MNSIHPPALDPRIPERGSPGLVRILAASLAVLVMAALGSSPVVAMETDQFLAWHAELDDIAPQLNDFFDGRIKAVLEDVNSRPAPPTACTALVDPIFRDMHQHPFASRLRSFLEKDESITRYPDDKGNFGYFKSSVYRRPAWPFYLPLASTVDVGGVLVGLDKFPHVFGSGRRYFNQYLEEMEAGATAEEAIRRAILYGAKQENGFLGRLADGVFSFADLEANYQGLLLAIDLCDGDRPYLAAGESGWELTRPIDLRDYINPLFDESYNNNRYSEYRWRQVEVILKRDYCPLFESDEIQALYAWYREIEKPSQSAVVVREFLAEKGTGPQWEHSMEVVCLQRETDGANASSDTH